MHELFVEGPAVSICSQCGCALPGDVDLCTYHHTVYGDDWAVANRIMCDLFHRGKIPPRLTAAERAEDVIHTPDGMF
ncbi:MAG TPA: hypothetical protein VEA69_14725 [Tepidisphaeraceae bacterium]|nr:hypothetical protein [Tepidisphaeraceae bacterium]